MIAKDVIFGPISILKRGKLQACRIVVAGFFYACFFTISGHAALPGQTVMECLSPLKVDITGPGCVAAFYFTKFFRGMISTENIRAQGKYSTLDPTSESRNDSSSITLRNDELLQKIDDYFDYSGVAEPIETLGVLLDAFVATGDSDEPGYTPTFLRDVSWEVTRLSAFLAYLYEQRNFMVESVKEKGGENGE